MEEVTTADGAEIQIDLKSDAFQPKEYQELVLTVEKCDGKVRNTQTSDGYVYNNLGFQPKELISEDRTCKLWVPLEHRQNIGLSR